LHGATGHLPHNFSLPAGGSPGYGAQVHTLGIAGYKGNFIIVDNDPDRTQVFGLYHITHRLALSEKSTGQIPLVWNDKGAAPLTANDKVCDTLRRPLKVSGYCRQFLSNQCDLDPVRGSGQLQLALKFTHSGLQDNQARLKQRVTQL
jgi:hypothetical protein